MRFLLAFSSFFRLLFGARLHPRAAAYLPEGARAALPEPDEPEREAAAKMPPPAEVRQAGSTRVSHHREGALAMLALLQREGRLIDFLKEDIEGYDDADIGAAVRDIHRGCNKVLTDSFTLEAVMPGSEDDEVRVPIGFDPADIRLIGEVKGEPPFTGVLRHHGWRVTRTELPELSDGVDRTVIAAAEVEIGGS